ncbi:hypothetical protein COP2_014926 [Malus domestica]
MIHKKGGRIRTYALRYPLGWVAGLAPLVASVPKTDALRYPARNLVPPTPLLVMPLPIAGGLFLALGLLSRQGECAFALFLRPVMLFPARHACFNSIDNIFCVQTSSSSSVG